MENQIIQCGFKKIYSNDLSQVSIKKGKNLDESEHVFNVQETKTASENFITANVLRQTSINQPAYSVKITKRERGRMRVHHLNNVNKALQILEQNNVKLVNISSNDIVDGNPKLTLGLVWSIILHWQVHYHLKDLMTELQQTNLEKTLLAWCRQNSQNYPGVDIKNFTTSWSDGLAFNALLHRWKPQLFDFNNLARKHPNARLDHAFRLAQEQLGIERLLDPEDVNTSVPDKKSIMMYVMCLFQSLPHSGDDVGDIDVSVASDSSPVTSPGAESTLTFANLGMPSSRPMSLATNVSVELGGYQVALEDVLTWLLEAEDKLNHEPDPGSTLELLKGQFHEHETFLKELSGHQDGVGAVLEEGARLLAEGGLQKDEEHEVRVQMSLLNSRWEGLRMRAMERQSRIHEVLMEMQQRQLDSLRQWLTKTEDRISLMASAELNQSALTDQVGQLNELEKDIREQQNVVDGLRNMVVVVDEENSEAVCAQMEDQLSALGERWTHICQWKEERRQRLQTLSTQWGELTDDCKKLVGWLNEREITLKQMEANPASQIGEVLERIKRLQVLKVEMDANQRKLSSLLKAVQDLESQGSTPESSSMLEKLENLQDRWEAVGQILEVQSQRISSSGFEFDLKTVTEKTEVTGNEWMTETVTSIAYKEELAAMASPHSDSKKRRLGSPTRQEFESAVINLYKWLDYVDLELGRSEGVFDELSVEEKRVVYEESVADIESRRSDYEKILELGKRLIQEIKEENEPTDEEEQKIKELQDCWTATNNQLQQIKDRIDFLSKLKLYQSELASLQLMLDGYSKWFEANQGNNQIELFRVKMKSMKSHEDRIKKLSLKATELIESKGAGDDKKAINEETEKFATHWDELYKKLTNRLTELSNAIDKTPPKRYNDTIANLLSFINNVEGVLLSEHAVMSDAKTMEEQLKKFNELQNSLRQQEDHFNYVNATGQELIAKMNGDSQGQRFKDELQDLNTKWSDIPIILEERQQKLLKDIDSLKAFNDELRSFEDWLEKSLRFLEEIAEDALVNDVETTEFKLEQIRSLKRDIDRTKPRIEGLQIATNKLLESSEPKFSHVLNNKLGTISHKWQAIVDGVKTQGDKYENALRKNDEIISGIGDFTKWLSALEKEIPTKVKITSSIELFQVRGSYQTLKDKVDKRVEEFRNLNEMGNDKLLSSEGSSVHELGRRFTYLNARWTDVTDRIYERYRQFQNASHEYGEFRALVAQESDWLDKLEKRLKKSTKTAADAEEISEELDDLENYVRNHPESRFAKIQEIGRQLVNSEIMIQSIQTDVEALTSRWENLSKKAGERAKLLEGSVRQAQQSEGRILALQHSLTQVDSVLTARLDCDLTADDLPHDYQKLMEEMENQQATLREMATQIEAYQNSGKHEAASRLQEQMSLIEKKFVEVQQKFQRFRCPIDLEPRLSRALRELRGIEEATCLLELASEDPETIEGQLKHCLRFYQTLSEIKSEIESIIVTGRKLVEDRNVPEPEKFSKRIDSLKELYNKLGLQITESKSTLESALELSRDMYKHMAYIGMSVESINKELDAQKSSPDLPVNVIYVNETLTEVIPRLNVVGDKLFRSQDEFSKLCDPMYLDQLREKVSDITNRLANTERRLRLCSGAEEEPNVDEINAWLVQTEEKLNQLDTVPVEQLGDRHFEQCKAIQSEMIETKPKITQLQRCSFYPKVAEVCAKWEEISSRIQEWIHKITDNLLIKSQADGSKGRDNSERDRSPGRATEASSTCRTNQGNKLADEDEEIYGIGYLNPAFDESGTPRSSPVEIPHRSRKSSGKSDKAQSRVTVDVGRAVRRRLDMSSVPDVVRTSQPAQSSDRGTAEDEEEFFLAKNSKLFSQVSTNTLTATDSRPAMTSARSNPFRIVEVREREIFKSVASPEDHVVLPSANISVEQMPQVVERVEIVEDTETDTDAEEKDAVVVGRVSPLVERRELVPILKRRKPDVRSETRAAKKLTLKLDIGDEGDVAFANLPEDALKQPPRVVTPGFKVSRRSTPAPPSTPCRDHVGWKDPDFAEYLILDDGPQSSGAREFEKTSGSGARKKEQRRFAPDVKKAELSKVFPVGGMVELMEEGKPYKKSPLPKRSRNRSPDNIAEDCESFYGSDKETDDALIFSDDTEIDVGSSSSEGEDAGLGEHVEHLLDKVTIKKPTQLAARKPEARTASETLSPRSPATSSRAQLEREIIEFEQSAQLMLRRMDVMLMTVGGVSNEKDPAKRLEVLKGEVSSLAPDAATLISKGDGLVMTVHMADPVRAEKIKNEHQDKLRSKWHQVMAETEARRVQAQRGEEALKQYNKLISEFVEWFRDAPLKLEQANNYEGQLESFTEEFDKKQKQIENLNALSGELKRLNVGHSETVRYSVNSNWQEISSKFKRLSGSKDKEKNVADKKVKLDVGGVSPQDAATRINKLREAVSTVSRSLHTTPLNARDYDAFPSQEDCLKKIGNALLILKPKVDEASYSCDGVSRSLTREQADQVRRLTQKLREEWTNVNRIYTERQDRWTKCYDKWKELHNVCWTFSEWLSRMEDALKAVHFSAQSKSSRTKIFEIEQEASRMQRTMNNIVSSGADVASRTSSPEDVAELQGMVESLKRRWSHLLAEINARKERNLAMERKLGNDDRILEAVCSTIEQVNSLLVSTANPSDDTSLSIRLSMIKAREEELVSRRKGLETLRNQHGIPHSEEDYKKILHDVEKASTNLPTHREYVESKLTSLKKYMHSLDAVMAWVMETRTRLNISRELPQQERNKVIDNIMVGVVDREMEVKDVLENYTNLEKECQSAKQPISVELQEKLKKLREDWQFVKNRGDPLVAEASSLTTAYVSSSRQKEVEKSVGAAPGVGAAAGGSWGLSPSSAPSTPSTPVVTSASATSSSTSPSPSPSSPPSALIAGLDKSVLQIRDWLTVEEEMLRQQAVVVGDVDEILQLLDKQKNVLRELEQKKPQLDELVHTAENLRADTNRQQLHGKDPRVKDWLLLSSPVPIFLILVAYVYGTLVLGRKYMVDREPYSLKTFIKVYNIFQIMANIGLIYGCLSSGWLTEVGLGCEAVDYSWNPLPYRLLQVYWWLLIVKLVDLLETVMFVLRKRDRQISFLHVYHHISSVLFAWIGAKYLAGGMGTFSLVLNSSVHVIMYTYYFLTTGGPKVQQVLRNVKPYITIIQMVQFCLIFLHGMQIFSPSCTYPKLIAYLFILNVVINFVLFYHFYNENYTTKKQL